MGSDDSRAIVTRFTIEAMGQGRVELCDELIAPDFIFHNGRQTRAAGQEGQRQAIQALHSAFSDFRVSIEDMACSGDRVAVRDRLVGIHTGSFAGIPPRGKKLDLMRIVIYRVAGGRIHESWAATEMLAMVKQLGGR